MRLRDFLTSPGGRFVTGATSFALVVGGVILLVGPGAHSAWTIPLATALAAVGFIAGIGLSIERFQNLVLPLLLLLPLGGGLYFVGLRKLLGSGGIGLVAIVVGYLIAVLTESGWKLVPKDEQPEPPAAAAGHGEQPH